MVDPSSRPSRCPLCAGPLSKDMETTKWTIAPLIRDSFCMIGSAVGGTASAFYGFNHAMPVVRRFVKGPLWVQFFIGVPRPSSIQRAGFTIPIHQAPPVIVFSSACAGLAGGAAPALAQLVSSSYHAAMSSSSLAHPSAQDESIRKTSSSPL